jgi:hypothetical protein
MPPELLGLGGVAAQSGRWRRRAATPVPRERRRRRPMRGARSRSRRSSPACRRLANGRGQARLQAPAKAGSPTRRPSRSSRLLRPLGPHCSSKRIRDSAGEDRSRYPTGPIARRRSRPSEVVREGEMHLRRGPPRDLLYLRRLSTLCPVECVQEPIGRHPLVRRRHLLRADRASATPHVPETHRIPVPLAW